MELIAAGKLPPEQPPVTPQSEPAPPTQTEDSSHYPPAFSVSPASHTEPLKPGQPSPAPELADARHAVQPEDSKEPTVVSPAASNPILEETPAALPPTGSEQPLPGESQNVEGTQAVVPSSENGLEPRIKDPSPELIEMLAAKSQDLERLTQEIEEKNEILREIQLDVHMYQERRGLLFREVQTLEKKASNLKELCDRLERKSTRLEKDG
jgi:hypothetical protein